MSLGNVCHFCISSRNFFYLFSYPLCEKENKSSCCLGHVIFCYSSNFCGIIFQKILLRIIVQVFISFAPDYYTIEPVLFESEVDNRHCVSLQLVFCRVVFSGNSCRSTINCWDDFVALGSWKGGRSPDLFDRRRQYRNGKFRLLRDAVRAKADIRASARG